MKDNIQPTTILEENSNEVTEQIEESQDLVVLTNSVSSNFLDVDDLDPITKAIRQEILQKQRDILREYIAQNHDVTVTNYDDQEFAEYLKNVNNRAIIYQAFADNKVKAELEKTEIAGYKKVHHNFADQFHTINWQDGDKQGNIRSQIVRNDSGDELATIKLDFGQKPLFFYKIESFIKTSTLSNFLRLLLICRSQDLILQTP